MTDGIVLTPGARDPDLLTCDRCGSVGRRSDPGPQGVILVSRQDDDGIWTVRQVHREHRQQGDGDVPWPDQEPM